MMDRNREPRRANNMAAGNGVTKRRHRSGGSSHRESPEHDAQVDLQESGGRLRDRVPGKKERERDRDRDRGDLDRDLAMMLMMSSGGSRSKRRRPDRLFVHQNNNHGGGRHFSGEDSSEESINEDEDDDDEKNEAMRMLPPHNPSNHSSIISSSSSPHHHLSSKKNFSQPLLPAASVALPVTPGVKPVRSPTPTATSTPPPLPPPWASDEMIGVSVPRKARSASTKRSHECRASGGGLHANDRNTSNSPAQSGGPSVPPSAVSSSNVAAKRKMKSTAPKQKPSKSSKSIPSTQDDIEFEIAEVLYGLMRQPQCPAKTDNASGNDAVRKEAESFTVRIDGEAKSRVSSPTHLSRSSVSTIVPKRKRPRPVKYEDVNPASFPVRSSSNQSAVKAENDFNVHTEPSSAKSDAAVDTGGVSITEPHVLPVEEANVEQGKAPISESEAREKHAIVKKEEPRSPSKIEIEKTPKTIPPFEPETQREKLEIDLMSPPSKLSPVLESESSTLQAAAAKENVENYEKPRKLASDESEFNLKETKLDLHIDLERDDTKHHQHGLKLQPPEKSASSPNSIPVPMSIAGWPHVGYMAPLQGVVSMDANALPSPALQNRLKRCATHCKIARNIHYHQQFSRMSPFWPGSTLPYGGKLPVPNTNPGLEKAHVPAVSGKEKNSVSAPASSVDAAQRKQILIRQPIPPGGPSNILHGPAFIFPLNQQQPNAAAGGARPVGGTASAVASASSAAAMNFSYPNIGPSEAPYLAILQNGAYSIPVPTHMGSAPAYRGAHPQPMPFYNGSFYSSQIIHPSQLQQPQPPAGQPQPNQRMLTPAQKPSQNPSQKSIVPQNFSALKNHASQPLQFQQRQPATSSNPAIQTQTGENVNDEDGRLARSNGGVYGQNFVVPIHPSNFAFMSQAAIAGNMNEKKQQPAAVAGKIALDSMQAPAFAMSFASMNGGTTAGGFDISSIAQNPALLQTLPEAARHGFHFMQAQAKGKPGDEEDRKSNAGSSIAFTRPDVTEASVSNLTGATVPPAAASNPHQPQLQRVSQQMIQQQKHHQQFTVSTPARSKAPAASNGNVFPDQWKNSSRTGASQIRPPQQNHAQISFGGNPKSAPAAGNSNPNTNNQSPPLLQTGSPTTSKGAGGSPRTAEKKAAPSSQPQKSTAANGGRNVPLILGHLQAGGSKLGLPNTHIYSAPYMPPQSHTAASSNKAAGGFYMHRQRGEPQPQVKGSASSSSHGMLSLCPPVGGEQGKKGGAVSYGQFAVPQASAKQHQVGFGYAHGGVQVKQGGDQKQPAGE